jgi:hypothetical protein
MSILCCVVCDDGQSPPQAVIFPVSHQGFAKRHCVSRLVNMIAENREDEWLSLAGSASAFQLRPRQAAALVHPRALPLMPAW